MSYQYSRLFKRFKSIPFNRKLLVFETCFFLSFWQIISKTIPLTWYKKQFGIKINKKKESLPAEIPEVASQISNIISTCSKILPWHPVCFPQALTLKTMLRRRNIKSVLCFGAAEDDKKMVKLHCWVEIYEVILIGGEVRDEYLLLESYQ